MNALLSNVGKLIAVGTFRGERGICVEVAGELVELTGLTERENAALRPAVASRVRITIERVST